MILSPEQKKKHTHTHTIKMTRTLIKKTRKNLMARWRKENLTDFRRPIHISLFPLTLIKENSMIWAV
jgi:hypothetical protein